MNEILVKRLSKARKKKGYTQADAAKYLNCNRATITNYEIGRRNPDIETLVKLAEYYEVSVDYLLGLSAIPMSEALKYNVRKDDVRITLDLPEGTVAISISYLLRNDKEGVILGSGIIKEEDIKSRYFNARELMKVIPKQQR